MSAIRLSAWNSGCAGRCKKIPVKYADADVARGIEKCFVEDAEELLQEEDPQARAKRLGLRIERGGLE
jgi:hypothetical protein